MRHCFVPFAVIGITSLNLSCQLIRGPVTPQPLKVMSFNIRKIFFLFNTHFDHIGETARLEKINKIKLFLKSMALLYRGKAMAKTKDRFLLLALVLVLILLSCRSEQNPLFQQETEKTADAEEVRNLFTLMQNSPNPFSSSTLIRFELKKTLVVTLRVSLQSHTVTLFSGVKEGPATHYILYEPDPSLPNGTYRYSLEVNGVYQQRAMTLQR